MNINLVYAVVVHTVIVGTCLGQHVLLVTLLPDDILGDIPGTTYMVSLTLYTTTHIW